MSGGPADHRGEAFVGQDFTGATFRDCDLRHVKVVDSWLGDVNVSGLVERFVVNDVDVTAYVEGELDRRHPERVVVRTTTTADDHRAAWTAIEGLWATTVERVGQLPATAADEQVDGEFSFSETLRHLVFCTDAWAVRTVLDRVDYHPLGLAFFGYPPDVAASIGLDADARPSFTDVLAVRADRMATVRAIVDRLDDGELERVCSAPPAPEYPDFPRTVRQCLSVVLREEVEHHRYAVRDLAVIERRVSERDR
jgi:hypothetical protein